VADCVSWKGEDRMSIWLEPPSPGAFVRGELNAGVNLGTIPSYLYLIRLPAHQSHIKATNPSCTVSQ